MKQVEKIRYNAEENWGGLTRPENHDAAIGARFADNRKRDFGIFNDRITVIGDAKIAEKLRKWLFRPSTLKKIKCNTSFSFYGGDRDTNLWSTMERVGKLSVLLYVECRGEYCNVQAYADKMSDDAIQLLPRVYTDGRTCWKVCIRDRFGNYPNIVTDSKEYAMSLLLDYISNELEGKDDIVP